jgi:hypothetical protein
MYDLFKTKNEAEKVRTMEMLIDDKEFINTHDVLELIRELEDNHGFAVTEIAEEIINRGGVRKVYDHYAAEYAKNFPNFKFEGTERFFKGGVISAYGIGCLGVELGLFKFDIAPVMVWAFDRILELRRIRAGAMIDCFDTIGQFLSEFNNQLVVVKTDTSVPNSKPVTQMPIPDLAVARVEINQDKKGVMLPGSKLMINVARLREWAKKSQEDINNVTHALGKAGVMLKEKERVTMYKGTHHNNPGQTQCMVLDLMHPRFAAVLSSSTAILPTNPMLAVVQGGKP